MPTSALAEYTDLTKLSGKSAASSWADVGIGPYRTPANSHCSANFERRAFIPPGARRDEPPLPAEETGLHFLFISGMLLYIALCTRYFLREGMDALWAEIRWI